MRLLLPPDLLARFEAFLAERLGMFSDATNRERIEDALVARIKATREVDATTYVRRLLELGPFMASELTALVEALTVGESYFYRGLDHLRAFVEAVLPERMRARDATRTLRILSAGCAAGEEPHTLALLIHDELPELWNWDVQILGIDLNPSILERARRGRYSPWAMRAVSAEAQARHFTFDGKEHALADRIRSRVQFEQRNLMAPDPLFWSPGRFDVIFCRNVLIYFTPDALAQVIERMAGSLTEHGFLFLGHSETLRGVSRSFHLKSSHETFYYQLRSPDDPPLAADPFWPAWSREGAAPEDPLAVSGTAERTDLGAPLPPLDARDDAWPELIQRSADRIAALDQAPLAAPAAPTPSWNLEDALGLFRNERYGEAAVRLRALPPAAARDPDALLLLAAVLTNHGAFAEAEEVCKRLIQLDELNAGAVYLLALCREQVGDPASATRHAQTAAYLDAGFAMPHLILARLAKRRGDLALARRELTQTLSLVAREETMRVLLFGGGFGREALVQLCRSELKACGGSA